MPNGLRLNVGPSKHFLIYFILIRKCYNLDNLKPDWIEYQFYTGYSKLNISKPIMTSNNKIPRIFSNFFYGSYGPLNFKSWLFNFRPPRSYQVI